MHGTAHWMAFSTLFTGGTVVISRPSTTSTRSRCGSSSRREQANFLVIVGDAFARPLVDALDTPDGAHARPLVAARPAVGRRDPLARGEARARRAPARRARRRRLRRVGDRRPGPVGRPSRAATIPSAPRFRVNDRHAVLDDDLRPAPAGVVGRLARRGHIPLGYYKDPEKTAATFPVVDGVRWSVPGDHAVLEDDGTITLLGRGSVSINTGGEKVYPEEVESVLKAHADVFDAVVVGVPDERWGERVVAVVQARPGARADARRPRRSTPATHLAGYKVPRDARARRRRSCAPRRASPTTAGRKATGTSPTDAPTAVRRATA